MSYRNLVMKALSKAKPHQLLKIRSEIEHLDQTAYGGLIFYADEALKQFDRGNFKHHKVEEGLALIGSGKLADILGQ